MKPKKLLWAFPGAKVAPAAPAPAQKPQAKGPDRVATSRKGGGVGGSLPPKKQSAIEAETVEDLLGPEPAPKQTTMRHPRTGQEMILPGPGRAPKLQRRNGAATGRDLYRYEGSEHWYSNEPSACHAWMAVFGPYFPLEAKLLVANRDADTIPEVDEDEEDLLS